MKGGMRLHAGLVLFGFLCFEDGSVVSANGAIAAAALLRARQIKNGTDVRRAAFFLALDGLEPYIDVHTLDAAAASFAAFRMLIERPFVFGRDAIWKVEPAVDEFGRRVHGLTFFDQFIV